MSEEIKKDENAKKETFVSRVQQETRIYDVLDKETRVVPRHRWIGEEDDDEPEVRVAPAADRRTRVGRDSNTRVGRDSNTRIMYRDGAADRSARADDPPGGSAGASGAARLREKLRSIVIALKSIKIADSKKFARFLKMVGALALVLLLEIGWFRFSSYTDSLPDRIKASEEELKLVKKESKLLKTEIEELGGYNTVEEQKKSWEKLKIETEKAAEATYY